MQDIYHKSLLTNIKSAGIIAVLVIQDPENAIPTAKALRRGGVHAMEIALRVDSAIESFKRIKKEVPDMLAGIGTILTKEQLKEVAILGAAFGVAPGLNIRVLKEAKKRRFPFAPGVCTPSDLELAIENGCRLVKLFPAEAIGGIKYLKSLNSPYAHLKLSYIPLGGVNTSNLKEWLQMSEVIAVGGSWIAKKELISARDWDTISRNAEEAMKIVEEVRGAE